MGDYATPEGRYRIEKKMPTSQYYKALLLDYPNAEDKKRFQLNKMEGIGYFLGGRTNTRWKAGLERQNSTKTESSGPAQSETVLKRKIERMAPKGIYIIIDTGKNILYLKNGTTTHLQAVVSCGSGNILQEPNGERRWIFDTPRGVFNVASKIKDPFWIKPDWAFVEEAKTIPINPQDRVEAGVLGEYALGFGDGYFIHGTLFSKERRN